MKNYTILKKAKTLVGFLGVLMILLGFNAENANAKIIYVSPEPSGNGATINSPMSIDRAFSTAVAGDVVKIKGGNYGHVHLVVGNSGTTFESYDGTAYLDGVNHDGYGITVSGKTNVTIKGIKVKRYYCGIWFTNFSHKGKLENVVADSCSKIGVGWEGIGIRIHKSDTCQLINCSATDNGGENISLLASNNCLIKDCGAYCEQTANPHDYITDYYFVLIWSSNNTIINCYAEDKKASTKGNHGFIIKDQADPGGTNFKIPSTGNKFIDCEAKNFEECFSVAHLANNNEFINCVGDNTRKKNSFNQVFVVRNGAHSNTFKNCTATGYRIVVGLTNYNEGNDLKKKDGNHFINCIFKSTGVEHSIGVAFDRTTNTIFENCTFHNMYYLGRYTGTNTDNSFINCIVYDVDVKYDDRVKPYPWGGTAYDGTGDLTVNNTCFHLNGFDPLSGSGNISADPLFVSSTDYHLQAGSPAINAGTTGTYAYDFDGVARPQGSAWDMGVYEYGAGSGGTTPVAYWKFDENAGSIATDNSGNINTGTLINSPIWAIGKIGSALNFTNNYVNVPSSTSIDSITNAVTISAWVKTTTTSQSVILERWLYGEGVNQRAYCLQIREGKVLFGISKDGTSANSKWLTSTIPVNDGNWRHVAGTFDGTTMQLYISGVQNTSVSAEFSAIYVPTGNLHIGKWENNSGVFEHPFIGIIDEVRLYKKALSSAEIAKLTNAPPTVTTTAISAITPNTATSGGNITYNGGAAVTARGVCWSTTTNPTTANSKTSNDTGTGSFTSSITGLTAGTTYYVRAYAINSYGTAYGAQVSFKTSAIAPTITTTSATAVTQTTAASGGNITSDGGASVTARGVCWSTAKNPTTSNSKTSNGTGAGSFTSSITGLTANTTYYVRAYATNSVGTAYGTQVSFKTSAIAPTITTTSATAVTQTTAASGGNITSDGGASVTARGVCWSTATNPTTANYNTSNGAGIGSFTSSIAGLFANTTYYVRAYATNSVGTAYGTQVSFKTAESVPNTYYEDFSDGVANNFVASSGTWAVESNQYSQSSTSNSNTIASVPVIQYGKLVYEWKTYFITSTSAGMHIMCDAPNGAGRGNSYLVFQNGTMLQIYESIGNALIKRTEASCTSAAGQNHTYKVIYDPATGQINAYRDGSTNPIVSWKDDSPLTSGSYISLRTNSTHAHFDDLSVKIYSNSTKSALDNEDGETETEIKTDTEITLSCYPNPFTSDLNISYTVPEEGSVLIQIYDFTGRAISRVVDEKQAAGSYNVAWNADERMTNGIYFCRIVINGYSKTSKIIML